MLRKTKISVKTLFEHVTLYFLPMVNPDGAERFKRRNFYDIDLNRDASRLQCPEAVILKSVFDSLKADFGFNSTRSKSSIFCWK